MDFWIVILFSTQRPGKTDLLVIKWFAYDSFPPPFQGIRDSEIIPEPNLNCSLG